MNTDKLDRFLDEMPQRGIPGCDLAVTVDGKEVYRHFSGFSDAEMKRPVSRDDLYWIFSATKVITCTAAMRLVEEGSLKLNDKVYNVLKWVALIVLPALATLYAVLSGIWDLPLGEQIPATITAVDTFLGALLGISTARYNKERVENE